MNRQPTDATGQFVYPRDIHIVITHTHLKLALDESKAKSTKEEKDSKGPAGWQTRKKRTNYLYKMFPKTAAYSLTYPGK